MAKSFPNTGATVGLAADRTAMTSMLEGQEFFETDTNKMFVYSGSGWVQTNSWSTTSGVTGVNNLIVPPSLRLSRSTAQSIPTSADTLITWTVEDLDTDGMFSSGTDITVQTTGIYIVSAGLAFGSNSTASRYVQILKNSTSVAGTIASSSGPAISGGTHTLSAACAVSLVATDIIRVNAFQNSGSSVNVGSTANTFENGSTFLSMVWTGRAS